MKKNLWLSALVGVALTGCVNDDVVTDAGLKQEMLFGTPALKTQTRANILGEISGTESYGGTETSPAENFKVFAWTYKSTDAYSAGLWDNNGLSPFFNSQGEEAHKGETYWATSITHYWPGAAFNLLFAAYSPATFDVKMKNSEGVLETVESTDEKPIVEFTPEITFDATGITIKNFEVQSVADYQYDLMYSDYAIGRNITNNGKSAVNLQFNHALSSIIFSAQAPSAATQTEITYKIVDAQLVGEFVTKGTFKQNIDVVNDGGEKIGPAWEFTETDKEDCNYAPTFNPVELKTNEPVQFTSGRSAMLLIPQKVPTGAVLRLTYEKKSSTSTLSNTVDIPLNEFVASKEVDGVNQDYVIDEWKPGYRYVYRVAFGENQPIYFNPSVTTWKDEPAAIYTIKYETPAENN